MIKYLQIPFYFDAQMMQEEVRSLDTNNWQLHYQKLHYEGEWSAISLRSIDGRADSIIIAPQENAEYNDTIFLKSCPYFQTILQNFKCPLQAVRLLKLNAGAIIKEHRDIELNFEKGEVRFHIPVITNEAVEFYLGKERLNMKEGECWYCNFNLPHSIANNSDVNRVHLVIDAKVNDWVKDIFDGTVIKKEISEDSRLDDETKKQMIIRFREMNTAVSLKMATDLEQTLLIKSPD